ncbi:ABC transporter substrate-binding protein [Candidatus Woesearchaeota archaeon]|nr:ABC transporter substrate-binding protein [Candidatus Woesearchaeota archaeon]
MKFKFMFAIMVMVLIAVAGCSNQLNGGAVAEDTIKIGYSAPFTGYLANLGEANFQGVELALEKINANGGVAGRPVELIVVDDKFEGQLTLKAFHKFFDIDDVNVMLTATYGGVLTVADLADEQEVVVINTVDTAEELAEAGEYVFAIGIYDEGIGYALADFANEQGKKVGVIFMNEDPFVQLVKEAFMERISKEPAVVEAYGAADTDFRTQIMKAKNAEVELLVVMGFEEAGLVLRQAREMGIEADFAGIDIFGTDALFENSKGAVKGAFFTSWDAEDKEKFEEFNKKFVAKNGHEPEQAMFTVLGYDAVMVVAEAMEQAIAEGKEPRGEALKEALHQIKGFEGVAGEITMEEDGIVRSIEEQMFKVVDKGEFEKI